MIRHRQHGKHRIDRPQARSGWRPAVKGRRTVPTAGDSHVEDQVAALVTSRLAAHAGFVTEPTAAEVRATAADAARQARAVLAALADPDDKLTATAAMRNRIEGAALALETVAGGRPGGVAYRLNTLLTGERSRDQCAMLGEYGPLRPGPAVWTTHWLVARHLVSLVAERRSLRAFMGGRGHQ